MLPVEFERGIDHERRHDPQHDGGPDREHGATEPTQLRDQILQVGAGERDVAGFLGDVDLHDLLDQGMGGALAELAALPAWDVVGLEVVDHETLVLSGSAPNPIGSGQIRPFAH